MADVKPKESEPAPYSQDDLTDLSSPILQSDSRDSQSPIPEPPLPSTLYEQRQKCELRRLLKHTCPELKGLGNMVEAEYADILNSGTGTDLSYQGEVQSRRWIFENGTVNTSDCHKETDLIEKWYKGDNTFEQLLNCFNEDGSLNGASEHDETSENVDEALRQEENLSVNVKAKRKMFENQLIEMSRQEFDDVIPRRIVVSEDEKGTVQIQKKDFETNRIKGTTDLSIIDITDPDQDCGEVYLGISKAKEVFEKGFDTENHSPPNESISIDETLKTNVKNRAHMFESTPLDRINWKNEAETDTLVPTMNKSLTSLHAFKVIHSHGALIEAGEDGHVRKANYSFIEEKDPEIHLEEVVMESVKSILLHILAKVHLNPVINFLKEDNQGNVEIRKIDIPTYQLPFTVNQEKEYRTTNIVQVIEDLLGQETCQRKGVLIQEPAMGSLETLVYVLFRHDSDDGTVMEPSKMNILANRSSDTLPNMCYPQPLNQNGALISTRHAENNVKEIQECFENRNLDYVQSLQKFSSDDDVRDISKQVEQNDVIIPGHFKEIKAIFDKNRENDGPHLNSERNALKDMDLESTGGYTSATEGEFKKGSIEYACGPGRRLYSQDRKELCSDKTDETTVTLPVVGNIVEHDELSNLHPDIIQQSTLDAKEFHQNIDEKQLYPCPTSSENEYITWTEEEDVLSKNLEAAWQQDTRDETLKGSVQAALDSLKKSSFNVTKGDFKAAMIYRNSGKTISGHKPIKTDTAVKQMPSEEIKASPETEQVTVEAQHEGAKTRQFQGQITNKQSPCFPLTNQTGPKPAIPPKPDHLKTVPSSNTMTNKSAKELNKLKSDSSPGEPKCAELINLTLKQEDAVLNVPGNCDTDVPSGLTVTEIQSSSSCIAMSRSDGNLILEEKSEPKNDEGSVGSSGSQASLCNFGIKSGQTMPPVKPKRIKMTTDKAVENPIPLEPKCKSSSSEHRTQPESNVTMREKKGRRESEAERRQRLSVHMDEIMKDNANAAMEIFDKLRKQEELKTILSKVEEIEGESSQEDGNLRKILDSVQKHVDSTNGVMEKEPESSETASECEILSSMQVAFGDLEKASAAIITLKEQTLSRLMEIEETIKKALYSVSTLKSDSDIVGLSGLFKESMIAGQYLPVSGNIRKISIGSSKSPNPQKLKNVRVPPKTINAEPGIQKAEKSKQELSLPEIKPRAGSPSSPSFISIQSTARKNTEVSATPKSQTSVTALTCYNIPAEKEKRQVSTLEVQTAPKAESVFGTKTIRENYEETDCFGNRFYSSTTSTVMTTQPDSQSCLRRKMMINPSTAAYSRINPTAIKGGQAPS